MKHSPFAGVAVRQEIAVAHGLTVAQVLEPCQRPERFAVRVEIAKRLHALGLSYPRINWLLNRSTAYYMVNDDFRERQRLRMYNRDRRQKASITMKPLPFAGMAIRKEVATAHKLTIAQLLEPGQKPERFVARVEVAKRLRELGLPLSQIGLLLNRDRSSITYMIDDEFRKRKCEHKRYKHHEASTLES